MVPEEATLNIKGIEYEYRAVNLIKDGGMQIPIMEYLEEKYQSPAILPKDSLQRAKVREICEIIASGIQSIQSSSTVLQKVRKLSNEEEKAEWAKLCINKGFIVLRGYLKPIEFFTHIFYTFS
uniref:Maleylacetoacetate isomerase n=1 Tax=Magallana gigas TaxID=29159 RepID=K1QZE0_MAGGI